MTAETAFWSRHGATLSPAQRQAVSHVDGPLLVVAGPGSGKTTVITYRVAHLVEVAEVAPQSLLVVTFTRAAADEMKARTAQLVSARSLAQVGFGTIHSLAYRILKAAGGKAPDILSDEQQLRLLRTVMRHLGLNTDDDEVLEMQGEISAAKGGARDPEQHQPAAIAAAEFRQVLSQYEAQKRRLGKVDFDDLLLECRRLLRERSDVQAACRARWRYVMVDEFQDTNPVQYEILQLIAAPLQNLCVVGDDDQSIYGWRGASPRALLEFARQYPGCRQVTLDVNYRSTGRVVAAGATAIGHNRGRFAKALRTPREPGKLPELWRPADTLQEALRVANLVRHHVAAGGSPADVGVIYRTNQQAHALSQVLERDGIPYRAIGGLPDLYRRWPVQDVLAYLRMAAGDQTWQLLEQVINRPTRYISREVLTAASALAAKGCPPLAAIGQTGLLPNWQLERFSELETHLARLAELPAPEAIGYVRAVIGYDDYLDEYYRRMGGSAEEVRGLLAEVQRAAPSVPLQQFLADLDRRTLEPHSGKGEGPAVTLCTCHKAKGLEFPLVVVAGAVDKLMPHRSASDLEEERRLFYVAITRAKDWLAVSCPHQVAGRDASPSPFVQEIVRHLAPTSDDGPPPPPPVRPVPKPKSRRSQGRSDAARTALAEALPVGAPAVGAAPLAGRTVWHRRYGEGRVESLDSDGRRLTIDFGGRRVSLDLMWCMSMPEFFRVLSPD